jgi:hypothetical protein
VRAGRASGKAVIRGRPRPGAAWQHSLHIGAFAADLLLHGGLRSSTKTLVPPWTPSTRASRTRSPALVGGDPSATILGSRAGVCDHRRDWNPALSDAADASRIAFAAASGRSGPSTDMRKRSAPQANGTTRFRRRSGHRCRGCRWVARWRASAPARCSAQQQHGKGREAQQKDHARPSCAEDCSTAPRRGFVPSARAMARGARGAPVDDVADSLGPSGKEAVRGGRERLVVPVPSAAIKHVRCSMGATEHRCQRGPYSTLYMPPPPCTSRGVPPLPSAIELGIASS